LPRRLFAAGVAAPPPLPPRQRPTTPLSLAYGFAVLNRTLVVCQGQISGVGEGVGFFADSRETLGVNARRVERAACPWVAGFAVRGECLGFGVVAVFLEVVAVGLDGDPAVFELERSAA
jgi:hypothetical protein